MNKVISELYFANIKCMSNRRDVRNPPPLHLGPHEYAKTCRFKDTHYKGYSNVVRFFPASSITRGYCTDCTTTRVRQQILYAVRTWIVPANVEATRSDLHTCGGNFDVHAVIFDPSDPHYDPEKFPALLSYFKGPETAPWTGGGDLIIPELRLSVVLRPQTEVIIDGCVYHYADKTFGVRFCTSSYNTEISEKSKLFDGFKWIAKKNFGSVTRINCTVVFTVLVVIPPHLPCGDSTTPSLWWSHYLVLEQWQRGQSHGTCVREQLVTEKLSSRRRVPQIEQTDDKTLLRTWNGLHNLLICSTLHPLPGNSWGNSATSQSYRSATVSFSCRSGTVKYENTCSRQ